MSVPGYQEYMFPILKVMYDERLYSRQELYGLTADAMKLTQEQMDDILPSQTMPTYVNRIGWALTYLKKAGLVEVPSRGHFIITAEGKRIVEDNVTDLNTKHLRRYPSFVAFQNLTHESKAKEEGDAVVEESTPHEKIEAYYSVIKKAICDDLLNKILEQSPYFFEKMVVKLLVAMGYGGNITDAGKATKKAGDEGIDGLIKEDKLGLDTIYIQAKRYARDNLVGRPTIQQFIGALQLKGARKGILITTSDFTKEARDAVSRSTTVSIVLINGMDLVDLMYEHNVGVSTEKTIVIKKVDNDYFEE
jgi:restriction system protein